MKRAILGDIHSKSANKDLTAEFFDSFAKYCKENQITSLCLLGDVYNQRAVVRSELQRMLVKAFSKLLAAGVKTIDIVVGNHDLDSLDVTDHSLDVFEWIYPKYIKVHTDATIVGDEMFIPYTRDYEKIQKTLEECEGKTVYCHLPITGFMLAPRLMEKNGVPLQWFSKAKKVYAGHFHAQQQKDNVVFPGSIFVNTYSEAGMDPHFLVIDDGVMSIERVKSLCPTVPRYYIHEVDPTWDYSGVDWDNNYHKFIISANILQDCVDFKNELVIVAKENAPRSLQFQYLTECIQEGKINENATLEEIFCNFIDEDGIKKNFMKRSEKEVVKTFGLKYMRDIDAPV